MAKDPVCGMEIDEKKAVFSAKYKGRTFYLCGKGCKAAFEKEPEKYLTGERSHSHSCC
jgi:YHS domain-containing protein